MKIAQICPYNIYRSGGVQEHILNLSKHLRTKGHEVKIIAPIAKGVKNTQDDVIPLGRCVTYFLSSTQTDMSIIIGGMKNPIRKVLEKEKFDILHFQEPWIPVMAMQILSEADVASVGTIHGTSADTLTGKSIEMIFRPVASYAVNSLDEVISVSESPLTYVRKFYDGPVHIIGNGIDLNIFKPDNKPFEKYKDGKKNILFIGRLDKRKGVIYLIKAFRRLKDKLGDVRLIIGGKGEQLDRIKKYVKKHKVPDVEILGFVKEEEKPRLYASCDIFCSPAVYGESFGIVLIEAMATGKPVIAGDNPGYRSVLKNKGSLFLIDPKDTGVFVEKLEALCLDKDLRDMMRRWGIEEVRKYSWEVITDRIVEVYKKALKKKKKKKSKKRVDEILKVFIEKLNGRIKQELSK